MPRGMIALDIEELARRHANHPRIDTEMENLRDAELIACLVSIGMPPHAAVALRTNGQLRFNAAQVWADLQDEKAGEPGRVDAQGYDAHGRLDMIRERFVRMRADQLIHDDPNRFL